MPELLAAADSLIDGKAEPPVGANGGSEGQGTALDGDTVAEMAAGWCRTFAANPRFGSTAEYGLSGLAAAVILSATPRCATAPPQLSVVRRPSTHTESCLAARSDCNDSTPFSAGALEYVDHRNYIPGFHFNCVREGGVSKGRG